MSFEFLSPHVEPPVRKEENCEQSNMTSFEKLADITRRMSLRINENVREQYGMNELVDDRGRIRTDNFSSENGGIYDEEEITDDESTVYALDRYNSAADTESVRKFYNERYSIDTPDGIVAHHRVEKEANKSNQAEMAITALLHKILQERFLVVRASVFDDYKNGMDNLILDKETGAVICAFDEVIRNEGDTKKAPVKLEKIKKKSLKGGAEAKYGLSLRDSVLARKHIRNIPVFYLSLESRDLDALTRSLFSDFDGSISEIERDIFSHLVRSIEEQKTILESLALPPVMERKLAAFGAPLETLHAILER